MRTAGRPRPVRSAECRLALAPAALLLAALMLAPGPARATDAERKLEALRSSVEAERARVTELRGKSEALARDLETMRGQSIIAARAAQESESALSELELKAMALDQQEQTYLEALRNRRAQLAVRLAAIERISVFPPEAALALPQSPVDTVRSALLLKTAVPIIEARAASLKFELDRLARVRAALVTQRRAIAEAKVRLEEHRSEVAAAVEHERELYGRTEAAAQSGETKIAELTAEAKDLRDLLDRIEAAERARAEALARVRPPVPPSAKPRGATAAPARLVTAGPVALAPRASATAAQPPGTAPSVVREGPETLAAVPPAASQPGERGTIIRSFAAAHGLITLPARGPIVRSFGEGGSGVTNKGIVIRTRPAAQIVAPFDGKVVFAGEFRGYGEILIIQHSEGYHTLLSGLSRIDAVTGQLVLAGEPVGAMGQSEGGNGPELYVELRRNGRPIDPLPWLASQTGKVSG